jgi:hypothetical protein
MYNATTLPSGDEFPMNHLSAGTELFLELFSDWEETSENTFSRHFGE